MFKRIIPFTVISGLVLSACAAAAQPRREAALPAATGAPAAAEAPRLLGAPEAGGAVQDQAGVKNAERIVIKNATLSLLVKDAPEAAAEIDKLATSMNGWVVSSDVHGTTYGPNNTPIKQASIIIRVPADRLPEALTRIKAMAVDVTNENVSGQDVTSEYTDLQSRLINLEAAERQLQNIMDGATRTEDVLSVYGQLVSVREQIEVIKGQIKYYDESAAFSQISVDLVPDVVAQPLDIGGWRPVGVIKDAFELLIRSLQGLVSVLIYLGICGVPFAIIFGVPSWLVLRAVLRRRRVAKQSTPVA